MSGGTQAAAPVLDLDRVAAVLFDVDGVVTDTARVHAAAWKRLFDEFLRERAAAGEPAAAPFDVRTDYVRHVDGRPRLDGVRGFLAARRITVPEGGPQDSPDARTVHGLGRRKDGYFHTELREHGVTAFGPAVRLVRLLRRRGVATAAVSASRNSATVLTAAGVAGLFDATVDGVDVARLGLPGKPDPAMFVAAARRLHRPVGACAVVEDALAGVEAGHRGGFGLVVGLARDRPTGDLLRAGADVAVRDLDELSIVGSRP